MLGFGSILVVALLPHAIGGDEAAEPVRIHMITFTTDMYSDRFSDSLAAKEAYAKHWGYTFKVYDESTLDCEKFREFRFRGDYRYCKLQALKVTYSKIDKRRKKEGETTRRDYIFWHDVDTSIMRPETPLLDFLDAAERAPMVFTDNALSLNNGVFFLEVSERGKHFLKSWWKGCRTGEWPWADNGCMYEVLLQMSGADQYTGRCRRFREEKFQQDRPEPPTGEQLMRCFNEEMDSMGIGCCGENRKIDGFKFLTGTKDSFNHHPCDDLERQKAFKDYDRSLIRQHCYIDGMFMVHSKDPNYCKESKKRVTALIKTKKNEL